MVVMFEVVSLGLLGPYNLCGQSMTRRAMDGGARGEGRGVKSIEPRLAVANTSPHGEPQETTARVVVGQGQT